MSCSKKTVGNACALQAASRFLNNEAGYYGVMQRHSAAAGGVILRPGGGYEYLRPASKGTSHTHGRYSYTVHKCTYTLLRFPAKRIHTKVASGHLSKAKSIVLCDYSQACFQSTIWTEEIFYPSFPYFKQDRTMQRQRNIVQYLSLGPELFSPLGSGPDRAYNKCVIERTAYARAASAPGWGGVIDGDSDASRLGR